MRPESNIDVVFLKDSAEAFTSSLNVWYDHTTFSFVVVRDAVVGFRIVFYILLRCFQNLIRIVTSFQCSVDMFQFFF